MADRFGPNGLTGEGIWAYADGQPPLWCAALNRFAPATFTKAVIAGGAAGNHTVTGISTTDILLAVLDLTTAADLTSEFTVTAADTINNAAGTDTTGDNLLVLWWHRVLA